MIKKTLLIVLGTRPEAIKLAPIAIAAKKREGVQVFICNTSQHREMSSQVLQLFSLQPDIDLDIMRANQTLTDITTAILGGLAGYLDRNVPDWVLVQGDTTTTLAAALAAFYRKLPVAHVEAGLRTGDVFAPWPEEMNRRLVADIATLHFPPTISAAANLRQEGIAERDMLVTGNTGIDALKWIVARLQDDSGLRDFAQRALERIGLQKLNAPNARPYVLITGHRRESFGRGFDEICEAIAVLAHRFPHYDFVYPVHPNPHVRTTVFGALGSGFLPNVFLTPPIDYLPFIVLMSGASLILTDSGGIQEEAPSLGKKVVVLREVTERREAIDTGLVRLAGTDKNEIVSSAVDALTGRWVVTHNNTEIYGDGRASERILDRILGHK